MIEEEEYLFRVCIFLLTFVLTKTVQRLIVKKKQKRIRTTWQEKWLKKRTKGQGMLNMIREEILQEDPDKYKNFLRMDNACFQELLNSIRSDIERQNTHLRESVSAEDRLAVTLRYLASGNTFRDLMFATRIHESTISLIIPNVCEAIISRLMPTYIKLPTNKEEWKNVAHDFQTTWNFPFCLGTLDGKHITFEPPKSAGSFYYNYKGTHSLVLLALVDANYKFLYVDVGVNGRISDGGVFRESSLRKGIDNNIFNFPDDENLPGTNIKVPYVMVADDAFPLTKIMMKPYPQRGLSIEQRIFNYRLSRARNTVENAFGILVNRFRVLRGTINLNPKKVETITLACCVLHNFLSSKTKKYIEMDSEQCNLGGISQQGGSRSSNEANNIRNQFCHYFNSTGAVPWQNRSIGI